MDIIPVISALALALLSVLLLFKRQKSQYAQHVSQLQPKKEKRSKPKPEFKDYTREDVAEHNKPEDAWIIIRDRRTNVLRVYDITDYVDEHPGGESILDHVGGEATEGFHGPQHPDSVFTMAETYWIGNIKEN